MNNTDNATRTGATVYLNGTRIDCSHKGRPSVTGAIRVESIINSHATLVEALEGFLFELSGEQFDGDGELDRLRKVDEAFRAARRKARAALALAKGTNGQH